MTWKESIDRGLDRVFHVFEWATRILLVVITVLISLQVLLRQVFGRGLVWAEEVSLICFIYITFFTMAIALHYDLHLRVQLFVAGLPKVLRKLVEGFDNLFLLFISIMMLYAGIQLTIHGTSSIMPATRWPTSVIYFPAPVAGIMCCLHQILRLTGITRSSVAEEYVEGVFKE